MSTFVKICGICSEGDLEQISALNPDALGFIQWPKSARYIAPETVGEWETPPAIQRVGVFVNPTEAELLHAVQTARLDVIQLHRISNDWRVDVAPFPEIEFWRALNPDEEDVQVSSFRFQRFLLDSYDPKTIGGTGKTCDWNKARALVESLGTPILLAGGLNPENVDEAIRVVKPWGVDISSGVEIEPGVKNIEKVTAFISAARGAVAE